MANDLNRHMCIGRLGKDPEMRAMASGEQVASFSVACSETWKDKKTGQKQEKTTWINYVAFGRLAEIIGKYVTKGSKVWLSGKLQTRKWQDQSGKDCYTTEIVASEMQMLDSRSSEAGHQSSDAAREFYTPQPEPTQGPQVEAFDDDIPF